MEALRGHGGPAGEHAPEGRDHADKSVARPVDSLAWQDDAPQVGMPGFARRGFRQGRHEGDMPPRGGDRLDHRLSLPGASRPPCLG